MIFVIIAIVAIIITGVLIAANSKGGFQMPSVLGMSDKKIAQNVVDYINNNQLSQSPASLVSVSRESGLVKVKIKIAEQEFDSYATKDGKLLFPQAINIGGETGKTTTDNNQQGTPKEVTKTDSPMVEAFVVARCPYGLQMQRAMAEAIKEQPALAQYMVVRYMGEVSSDGKSTTAMHGDAEAKENLRQICIREEQPAKYWNYVACQMKAGDTTGCEKSTGVDSTKLNSCISTPSKGVAYAKADFDLNAKYGVTGSPTMILNGTKVDEGSYGGRSSDGVRGMVCAGFNTEAGFCSTKLNTAGAAASFSETYADSGASASANSGADGANCAPAQ